MTNYKTPLSNINFLLNTLGLPDVLALDNFKDFTPDLIEAVLTEAGKFADEKLAPINASGDRQGCSKAHDGIIGTPDGFKEAYAEFIANGWNSVPFSPEHGGQGLPWMVSTAISEMWSGANMAFALCPLLTQGSVELLTSHGSAEQQQKYLPNLISGQWTGTMCLTESQAGSDVGAVRTIATKNGDHYLIKGQKIFITYGDHDYTDNIIHMVLARTPDAPEGVRGISLFIVPKIMDDGAVNDVKSISIEHKLGIHASPTAVLAFGDNDNCVGYLVGEENQGLKYMFTMMNNARLAVGVEGVALAENSLQKAREFAAERTQFGKPIEQFGDVKRMLLTIEAHTVAMRGLALYTAKCLDLSKNDEKYQGIADILIPVLKSHATDIGFEMSSMAMQVFGGIGYVEETGIAQNLRDSRIAMIYEGTNGIQAMDLVGRKIMINDGKNFEYLREDIAALYKASAHEAKIAEALDKLAKSTERMRSLDEETKQFEAAYYLKEFALTMGAVILAACEKNGDEQMKKLAEFYLEYLLGC